MMIVAAIRRMKCAVRPGLALWGGGLLAVLLCGCAPATVAVEGYSVSTKTLNSLIYRGIGELPWGVRLLNGHWQGNPSVPDSALVPTVDLLDNSVARGDIDGDGQEDAVVLLDYRPGGSGSFTYLAVVQARQGQAHNVATQLLGDRVQVRALRVEKGRIVADMVAAGWDDPACCPSQKLRRTWEMIDEKLQQLPETTPSSRVSVQDIGEQEWVLEQWREGEAVAADAAVTLAWREGKLVGLGGCNRYFVGVRDGEVAGDIIVAAAGGATRMACPEPAMANEQRFLGLLAKVKSFRFQPGRLALTYVLDGGESGTLLFKRGAP